MAKGYWLCFYRSISNPDAVAEYAKLAGPAIQGGGGRFLGRGLPTKTFKGDYMLFHKGGSVNFPRKAHAAWFMTQYVRFGYLKALPDVKTIASNLILTDLYKEVAKEMKLSVPGDDMSAFTVKLDNAKFDPNKPDAYLKAHPI